MALELIFGIALCAMLVCLNPCSNGMALEHYDYNNFFRSSSVLILVLMEWRWLVLMEWRWNLSELYLLFLIKSLNPCSNGMALEHY